MKKHLLLLLFCLILHSQKIDALSKEEIKKLGMLIYQNEASKRKKLLVFWNQYESFPSLGIGHCIWFPEGKKPPYTEEFPLLCNYLEKNGIKLPKWLKIAKGKGAPWKSREEFLNDKKKTEELRELLASTITLQTDFMIERLERMQSKLLKSVLPNHRPKIKSILKLMRSSLLGTYALVDYLNFKGSGINAKEVSNGHRWGLLQVLLDMPNLDKLTKENVTKAFTTSAAKILLRLIQNSAPGYSRLKFFKGWMNRIYTYSDIKIIK